MNIQSSRSRNEMCILYHGSTNYLLIKVLEFWEMMGPLQESNKMCLTNFPGFAAWWLIQKLFTSLNEEKWNPYLQKRCPPKKFSQGIFSAYGEKKYHVFEVLFFRLYATGIAIIKNVRNLFNKNLLNPDFFHRNTKIINP